jgi:aldose 1-epimerase
LSATGLTLQCGDAICEVYPAIGGSIGRWTIGDQAMMRTATPEAIARGDALGMASFPLVPYSNRIGHAQFDWAGETVTLSPNFAPEPHAVHGVGWRRAWQIMATQADRVTLKLHHDADEEWPWPFTATQVIVLGADELVLSLTTTNDADRPLPLGFGHHPYFDAAGATLAFGADSVWMTGDNALPTVAIKPTGTFDFSSCTAVEGHAIDHCYAGIAGSAKIRWATRPWSLAITSDLPAAVVYIPCGGDAFCFEPVPHINNALNLTGHAPSMPVVAPGDAFETTITFKAEQP